MSLRYINKENILSLKYQKFLHPLSNDFCNTNQVNIEMCLCFL